MNKMTSNSEESVNIEFDYNLETLFSQPQNETFNPATEINLDELVNNIECDNNLQSIISKSGENTVTQDFNEVSIQSQPPNETIAPATEMNSNFEESVNVELDYNLETLFSQPQNETITPATESNSPSKKKKYDWDSDQKLAIIIEAKSSSTVRETATRYGISKGCLQRWMENEEKIRAEVGETTTPATEINSPGKKKTQNWTLEQMLAIIDDAKSSSDMEAAGKHGVSVDVIQHWRKSEAKILATINEAKSS